MASPLFQTDAAADGAAATPADASAGHARRLVDEAFAVLYSDAAAAQALASQALALEQGQVDPSLHAQALHALGMSECLLGRVAEGATLLQDATAALHAHGPARAECTALCDLGAALTNLTGDLQGGAEAFERALALAESLGDQHLQGQVLGRLGPLFGRMGRLDEAEARLRAALARLDASADRRACGNAWVNLGFVQIERGEFAAAVPHLEQALQLLDDEHDRHWRSAAESNLAIAWAGSGRATEALALLDDLGKRLDASTDGYEWANLLANRGRVLLLCGDPQAARACLNEGLDFARKHALHATEIDLLVHLCDAEERCGQLAAALTHQRALRAAERCLQDAQTAERVRVLQARIELSEQRAENKALERLRAELEQRVDERTAALRQQVRDREAAEEQARYWADHDWLTRLPNRHRLQTGLAAAMARARREGAPLGVLFIDLDGFKAVNDAHGHLAGDRLLRSTSRRLVRVAPPGALVARFGGDEFVVVLSGLRDVQEAAAVAQDLRAAVMTPLRLDGRRVRLSCSIGVALGTHGARTADQLVREADRAMLQAKADGRNQVCVLDSDGQDRLDRRGRLRREWGAALEQGRLHAAFQPMVELNTGRLAGVELLARWHDPELGDIAPEEFIPLAEESGLIGSLGAWALREGLRAARTLRGQASRPGDAEVRVGVNVSPAQLADVALVEKLLKVVQAEGGDPSWIELELTESVQLAEDHASLERLRRLREAGFHLALDDFGAGYSSFNYLSRLVFERLKIDRGLVHAAMQSPERSAVTASIIAMARGLGLQVVAEGIETAAQQALLAAQGCDIVQGFHVARPMSLQELQAWLAEAG